MSISTGPDGREEVRRGGGGLVSGMVSALSRGRRPVGVRGAERRERAAARRAPDGHLAEAGYDTGGLDVRMLHRRPVDVPPGLQRRSPTRRSGSSTTCSTTAPNTPVFDAGWRRLWAAYERYNRAFADALAEEAAPGAKVMVQDYHLTLVPAMLRELRGPTCASAHFTHTPWAPPEYFAMLPDDGRRARCSTGMLGADHVGFLTARWAEAFLRCCARCWAPTWTGGAGPCTTRAGPTRIGVHALGVDARELRERAARAGRRGRRCARCASRSATAS